MADRSVVTKPVYAWLERKSTLWGITVAFRPERSHEGNLPGFEHANGSKSGSAASDGLLHILGNRPPNGYDKPNRYAEGADRIRLGAGGGK